MKTSKKDWALVTGVGGQLGRSIAETMLSAGFQVLGVDIKSRCDLEDEDFVFHQMDLNRYVEEEEYAREFSSYVKALVGGSGLSVLVNNAAVQVLGASDELDRRAWRETLNVNLSAPFFLTQALLPLLESRNGAVVNVSSIHARQTKPDFVAYATSKAALSSLTRNLAVDLASRVRVNAIEPAAIDTPMLQAGFIGKEADLAKLKDYHPMKRIASPEEVAEIVLFLSREKAGFIHGATIDVTGGIHACLHDPV